MEQVLGGAATAASNPLRFSREALGSLVHAQHDSPADDLHIALDVGGVDATAMLGVPELLLEKVPYHCVFCHAKLRGELVCTADTRLAQLKGPWTACERCFAKRRAALPACSFVHLQGVHTQRAAYHSFALRVRNRFVCYAANQCIGEVASDGTVQYITYAELYDHARRLSTALQVVLGPAGSDAAVMLRSENRGWWIAADAAITFGGYVCAPVATSVAPSAMREMLDLTAAQAVLCSGTQLAAVVKCVAGAAPPSLKLVVVLGAMPPQRPAGWPSRVWLMDYREALAMGASIAPVRFSENPRQDLRTLIFTSGSTGAPKGVMICDAQMTEELDTVERNAPSCSFCFEPLALAASRINTWRSLLNGGRIDMFSGDFSRFWTEVKVCCVVRCLLF